MSTEALLPGLNHTVGGSECAPEISEEYREILNKLVLTHHNGVTHFLGGPLDLDDDKKVWLSPVEVDDGETYSYFQLIYVNTDPLELQEDPASVPASMS